MAVPLLHFYWLSERRKKLIKIKPGKKKKQKHKQTLVLRDLPERTKDPQRTTWYLALVLFLQNCLQPHGNQRGFSKHFIIVITVIYTLEPVLL